MIWPSESEPGVAHEIGKLLDGISPAGGAQSWLDEGQRASLAALRDRLCEGGKIGGKPGAILADEVGMGKTRIAVALALAVIRAGGRIAVVVPPGLIHQWKREFQEVFSRVGETADRLQIVRRIDDLLAQSNSSLAKASVVLLPHGLLNFRMGDGANTEARVNAYMAILNSRHNFRRDLLTADERKTLRGLAESLRRTTAPPSQDLGVGRDERRTFISFLLSRLGCFDLLVIDEAHKNKRNDDAPDRKGENNLTQLLERLERTSPKRLCLTATPFELEAKNWAQILKRAGATDEEARVISDAASTFLNSLKAVQFAPIHDRAEQFKKDSTDFKDKLCPWLIRRRKAVSGDDSVIARYVRDHGRNYRDHDITVKAEISGAEWPRAVMAVEALSMMPATDVRKQKWLRLALARGFSLSAAVDAISGGEIGDWSRTDQESLEDQTEPAVPADQKDRRRARAEYWLKAMAPAGKTPYSHPTLVATVTEIERIATHGDNPEKVLVFGRFTEALKNLTDLLNARELIRRLMIFKHDRDAPASKWVWPGRVLPDTGNLQAAFHAALKMEDMVRLLGGTDYGNLVELVEDQYDKHRSLREKDFRAIREFVKGSSDPALRSFSDQEDRFPALASALIEILDEHRANGVETQLDEVWKEFKRDLRQLEEDADKVEDRKLSDRVSVGQEEYTDGAEARELAEDISVALDEYQGRSDRFARILDGGTKASTRQHLQSAFNRRSSWPMVLVAQSLVGREGLNLHKACRTVVLFQPEWNPGVVEQQIGRVDRMGSLWEEMVKQDPSNKTIRIRVLPVMFRGTYDEHNWKVLMARWDDYRAQMSGEVFAVNCNDDPELSNLKEMVNKSAPDFTPPSIVR